MLLPLNGSRRGRETEADSKQPDIALWRRRETDKNGTHGQEQDRQQTIANSGGRMSRPCAPPGAKRFNTLCLIWIICLFIFELWSACEIGRVAEFTSSVKI